MKRLWLIIFLLHSSLSTIKCQSTPESIADSFFYYFRNNGVEYSIKYIFRTNKYLSQNPEIISTLKGKFDKALPLIGRFHRYEKYLDKRVGDTFVHIGYLMIFDRQPIKIIFTMYKPLDKWQVQDMRFEDKMDDVIKELKNKIE